MMASLHLLKRLSCSVALPLVNATAPGPLAYGVVTFCTSNNTVFEAALHTLDQVPLAPNALAAPPIAAVAKNVSGSQQVLTELMLTEPEQMSTLAGAAVVVFDQLQNETSLWEILLALPRLLTFSSAEQLLDTTADLLTNVKR